MRIPVQLRHSLKRLVFGPNDFPQQYAVGMSDPQSEVSVWLNGLGAARDVTHRHLMACGAPFTIGIGLDREDDKSRTEHAELSLQFRQQRGKDRLLGEIGLRPSSLITVGNQELGLFHVRNYRNYCQCKARLWARYLQYAYQRSRTSHSDVPITAAEVHAMIVFYICPRPVVLVSATDGSANNMFPINLMGTIGGGYFAFALKSNTPASALVERSGFAALSSVPMEQTFLAFSFGKNHRKKSIDWNQLPFPIRRSAKLGLPVPGFSLRIREMQIEATRKVGSHTLFLAQTLHDEHLADGPEFFVVHGLYQAYRVQKLGVIA
jgi:flavin reductase (DIM6/NTAB) family NADH-FMN oxidoreductase RutF